ncbi:MAG: hypothetical protein AYL32_010590 [Candidatus Bathyarchaeota archaeon B26-2]|nr:MAG: hypothetical protein AYL32_010590 [Candidatus Bathyarchaeota archaeon B26-2]
MEALPAASLLNMWKKLREYTQLSEYEAKVYVALVREGPSTASELSKASKVPRTKIYQTLRKLIEKGLVAEMPSEPKIFTATSPSAAFGPHIESFEEQARDFYSMVNFLENAYEKASTTAKTRRDDLWVIHGKPNIMKAIRDLFLRAERTAYILTTENGLIQIFKDCNKTFDRLVENRVDVHISTSIGFRNRGIVQELRHICSVHKVDRDEVPPSTLFISIDQKETLIAIMEVGDPNPFPYEDVAVLFRNPILCAILSRILFKVSKIPIHI